MSWEGKTKIWIIGSRLPCRKLYHTLALLLLLSCSFLIVYLNNKKNRNVEEVNLIGTEPIGYIT